MKKQSARRRPTPPLVVAVKPVEKRLAAIESLLLEIRYEQDLKLKRLNAIQLRLDGLVDTVEMNRLAIHRLTSRLTRARASKRT